MKKRKITLLNKAAIIGMVFSLFVGPVYGLEVEWTSDDKGFSQVKWGHAIYGALEVPSKTLPLLKAASSLYQGLQDSDFPFNDSPNFASLAIGFVVEESGEERVFRYSVQSPYQKQLIFSSSNKGVYGRDLISAVIRYLGGADNWEICSYSDLYREARPGLVRPETGGIIHSEDLMVLFFSSPLGRKFLKDCLADIRSQKGETPLNLNGVELLIHSWWDVCEGCMRHLRHQKSAFLPDECSLTELGFTKKSTPSFLLHTFSEMPYKENPATLSKKPAVITVREGQLVGIVAGRRAATFYQREVFSPLLNKMITIIKSFTPLERALVRERKRRIIESDDEMEPATAPSSITDIPLEVLKWVGMIIAHPGNQPLLEAAGLADTHILAFRDRMLLPNLWEFPFAHHYGWDRRNRLDERREPAKELPFLFKETEPPYLLLSGKKSSALGIQSSEGNLQRKWLGYTHYTYGLPHFGWQEVTNVDVEEGVGLPGKTGTAQCQMCGNTKLIHLHHVMHPKDLRHLFVGSECVQFMTMKESAVTESMKKAEKKLNKHLKVSVADDHERKRLRRAKERREDQ